MFYVTKAGSGGQTVFFDRADCLGVYEWWVEHRSEARGFTSYARALEVAGRYGGRVVGTGGLTAKHDALVHPDGSKCPDGCDAAPMVRS